MLTQAQINSELLPLGDNGLARLVYRIDLFERQGHPTPRAERIADYLALRDQQRDDRRLCCECSNLRGNTTQHACAKRKPVLTVLQRCPTFNLQRPQP